MRNRQQIATADPDLAVVVTDDGSRTLKCLRTGVTWHSESGALAESQLVFLENSGIGEILSQKQPARVYETGFGTGLNFWLTASVALHHNASLEYTSTETRLLTMDIIRQLEYDGIDACRPAFDMFAEGVFESQINRKVANGVQLEIVKPEQRMGKANKLVLNPPYPPLKKGGISSSGFDAVYHDPFGPDDAPELWTTELFQQMYDLLKPGGRLVTYCVKSAIQRRLQSVGFEVGKTRGPAGGKREVLIATNKARHEQPGL